MNKSLDTFISSTFWSERIGPVAALETLKIMEESKKLENNNLTWKKSKKKMGRFSQKIWH